MDTKAIGKELRRRREAAAHRAGEARRRLEELRMHLARDRDPEDPGVAVARAQRREEEAHRGAELTHKRSADLHEERARELRRAGAVEAADHAEERADSERENAEIEADRLREASGRDPSPPELQ